MTDASAGTPLEVSHAIDYSVLTDAVHNLNFEGPGTLVIRADGPTYTFFGRLRGSATEEIAQHVFNAGDIVDVEVAGRMIQLRTQPGGPENKSQPFVFYCRDREEARTVASLLPARVDAKLAEAQDFAARLNSVDQARSPWTSATNLIIALNVAVFVVMGSLGAGWITTESMMPYILYGANNGAATTDGEWWRLLTSVFMHYGIMHLALNMWALYQAGHFVEKLQGRWLYVLTYLGSGIAGGFASIVWHKSEPIWSAGASGAVFGVYGAILGYILREKHAIPASVYQSMLKSTLTFAGYNIVYGLARSGIDNSAHLGGVLGGVAFGWLLALPLDREVRQREAARRQQLGAGVLVALIVVGIAVAPRYDYSIRELLALDDVNQEFVDHESSLLKESEPVLDRLGSGSEPTEAIGLIEAQLIPFYENWNSRLAALHLNSAKSTEKARLELVKILDLRLKSYHAVVAGLRAHDKNALSRFAAENAEVAAEIAKLQNSQKSP